MAAAGIRSPPFVQSKTYPDYSCTAAALATTTGAISAVLWQVPNQPCLFAADPKQQQRVEGETMRTPWLPTATLSRLSLKLCR